MLRLCYVFQCLKHGLNKVKKMNNSDKSLGCLLVFLGLIFGVIFIGYLFYYVLFILELSKVSWIAFPCGIIGLLYVSCIMTAAQK